LKNLKYYALILVLALGMMGAAYAWWSDELAVAGTVETGTLEVGVSEDYGNGNYEKVTEYEYDEEENEVSFKIENLYPRESNDDEAYPWISLTIENEGTIPVKVSGIEVASDDDIVKDYLRFKRGETWDMSLQDLEGHLKSPLVDAELDVGEEHEATTWFYLCRNAGDEQQNQSGSFTVTFDFKQWNR